MLHMIAERLEDGEITAEDVASVTFVRRPFGKGASRALGKGATPRRVGV